ncbi:MAG: hypothetical protein WCO60_04420 [Verrucomicrobiota bacterium]
MRHRCFPPSALPIVAIFALSTAAYAQIATPEIVKSELERCQRRLREVRVEMMNRYESELPKLRVKFQKAADLESSLLIRAEEQRMASDRTLDASNLVDDPRSLRELQDSIIQKQTELIAQVVADSVPKLVELKKGLTVAGRLDEAVEVRAAIMEIQGTGTPAQRMPSGTQVSVEDVYQAYQTSRERADKMYKGVKVLLSGRVMGVRPDPRDSNNIVLVLFGGSEGALVDCAFAINDYRLREERSGGNVFFVLNSLSANQPPVKIQRGMNVEFMGKCDGWDGAVRFSGCTIPRR